MKMKKRLLALLLAAVLVMSLTGCKETLKNVAQKVTGSSNQVQEEDTTRWADATSDQLIIQGIADASAKFDTAVVDGGAEYVPDSTYYIKTDGQNYTCTVSGLDPAAQYRVTISYDSSRYYLYGLLKVEGVG